MAPVDPAGERLVLPADLDRLAEARSWARQHAEAAGFSGRDLGEIELAVTEAVSNVIRHGYRDVDDGTVELQVEVSDRELVLRIVDEGPAFDPTQGEPVELSEPRPGGYGLYLIETVMDEVAWRRREDDTNELRLVRTKPAS